MAHNICFLWRPKFRLFLDHVGTLVLFGTSSELPTLVDPLHTLPFFVSFVYLQKMEGPSSAPCDDFALDGTVVRASTDKLPKARHIIPCWKVAMLQPPTTWKEGTSDDVASSISEVYGSAKTRLHFKCANSVIFEIFRIF